MSLLPNQTTISPSTFFFALSGAGPGNNVSSFNTASISSLTVSSINGAVPGGGSISSFTTASISSLNFSTSLMTVYNNLGNNFSSAELIDVQAVNGYQYKFYAFGVPVQAMPVFQLSQSRSGLGNVTLGGDIGIGGIYLFGNASTDTFAQNSYITHNEGTSTLVITNNTTGVNISSPVLSLNSNTIISYGTTSTITFAQLISSVQGHS